MIVSMRKQNLSVYDISRILKTKATCLSPVSVSNILKEEGFARLPRRRDDERPPLIGPTTAEVADVRQLDLSPQSFKTKFGGLFLFTIFIASIPFDEIVKQAGFPGSKMIPAGCALRSLLGLKTVRAKARHSHVMSYVLDPGLALFAGLNCIPKRAFLTEYSCRIDPGFYPKMMQLWFDAMQSIGIDRGFTFDHRFSYHPLSW